MGVDPGVEVGVRPPIVGPRYVEHKDRGPGSAIGASSIPPHERQREHPAPLLGDYRVFNFIEPERCQATMFLTIEASRSPGSVRA